MSSDRSQQQQGRHCALSDCRQLDLLPFFCIHCERWHCLQHRNPDAHHCPQSYAQRVSTGSQSRPTSRPCAAAHCTGVAAEGLHCVGCGAPLCVMHRHAESHQCAARKVVLQHHSKKPLSGSEVLAAAKARLGISKDFGGKSGSKGKANIGVSSKAKAKANLLKLRRKAVGDSYVPEADRVYFEMVFEEQRVPMWMNRRWNVSRVVKEFRDYLRLRIGIAVQEKSGFLLALFVQDGMGGKEGRSLLDIDAALEDLMEQKTIHDGATLSMEFIPTLS